jgi:hypothetical protein
LDGKGFSDKEKINLISQLITEANVAVSDGVLHKTIASKLEGQKSRVFITKFQNHSSTYVSIPKLKKTIDWEDEVAAYNNCQKNNLSMSDFKTVAGTIGGDVYSGVRLITKYAGNIDSKVYDGGEVRPELLDGFSAGCFDSRRPTADSQRLTVEETAAYSSATGATENHIDKANTFFGNVKGSPIFATKNDRSAARRAAVGEGLDQVFSKVIADIKGSDKVYRKTEMSMWSVLLVNSVMADMAKQITDRTRRLNEMEDLGDEPTMWGVQLNHNLLNKKMEVVVVGSGDKGNKVFRMGYNLHTSGGLGQGICTPIVNLQGNDTWDTINKSSTTVADGFAMLGKIKAIIIQPKVKKDSATSPPLFCNVPKEAVIFTNSSHQCGFSDTFAPGVSFLKDIKGDVIGLKVGNEEYPFEHGGTFPSAMELFIQSVYYRVLLTGDLAYYAAIQGREGASGNWCLYCQAFKTEWRKNKCSRDAWTIAKLKEVRKKFASTTPLADQQARDKYNSKLGTARMGVRIGEENIFNVDLDDYVVSGLHILLGLTQDLLEGVDDLICTQIQHCTDEELQKRIGLIEAKALVEKCEEERDVKLRALDLQNDSLKNAKESVVSMKRELQSRAANDSREQDKKEKEKAKKVLEKAKKKEREEKEKEKEKEREEKATQAGKSVKKKPVKKKTVEKKIKPPAKAKPPKKAAPLVGTIEDDRPNSEIEAAIKRDEAKVLKFSLAKNKAEKEYNEVAKKYSEAKASVSKLKKDLTAFLSKQDPGKCEQEFTDILHKYLIAREVYHGGCLIGPCCKRLLENAAAIFVDLRIALKANKKAGVTDAFIDEEIYKFDMLFRHLDICCSVMRSTEFQTNEAIAKFKYSAERFGTLYRLYRPNKSITPKFHLLESHVLEQLIRFGTVGLFSEDPIERMHHEHLVAMRKVCCLRDFEKRERYLHQRRCLCSSAGVTAIVVQGQAKKRKWSEATKEKLAAKLSTKHDHKLIIKVEKVDAIDKAGKY